MNDRRGLDERFFRADTSVGISRFLCRVRTHIEPSQPDDQEPLA